MDPNMPPSIEPRVIGARLKEARRSRGIIQETAAEQIGVSRTTITAMEQGLRRVSPVELMKLASLYGRTVNELVRLGEPVEDFAVQLRSTLGQRASEEADLSIYVAVFQRLCEDYFELERICNAPMNRKYPEMYQIQHVEPEGAGEDIAMTERNRLGMGDGPILHLRELLESDVGLRIFYIDLPSRVAAMFAYTEKFGGCIAVNLKHPEERRRMSIAHDYAHFLTHRFRADIVRLGQHQRKPAHERFADAFARYFIMSPAGLRRRYNDLLQSREGRITPADLCRLADYYSVSVEALTRMLEELRLLKVGTWDKLVGDGFRVREAQNMLDLPGHRNTEYPLPSRYYYLAVEAFRRGDISEGQFAHFLRLDRRAARELATHFSTQFDLTEGGALGELPLDLGNILQVTRGQTG